MPEMRHDPGREALKQYYFDGSQKVDEGDNFLRDVKLLGVLPLWFNQNI